MARTPKLTPEVQQKICAIITQTACSIEGAAAACDITAQTIYNWRSRGMVEGKGVYFGFFEALQRAREKSEPTLAACIARAAKDDWKAALTILERRFPDRWGNQITVIRRFQDMSDEQLDTYLAARLAEPGPEDEAGAGGEVGAEATETAAEP